MFVYKSVDLERELESESESFLVRIRLKFETKASFWPARKSC